MAKNIPLVFSCSGCSVAGQVANRVALHMDEAGHAEMSCLAGVAAGKKGFLRKIRNRKIVVIDGCAQRCGAGVFQNLGKAPVQSVMLGDFGIKKNVKVKISDEELSSRILSLTKEKVPD